MIGMEQGSRRDALIALQTTIEPQITKLQEMASHISQQSMERPIVVEELSKVSEAISAAVKIESHKLSSAGLSQKKQKSFDGEISIWSGLVPRIISVRITMLLMVAGGLFGQVPRNGLNGAIAIFIGVTFLSFVVIGLKYFLAFIDGPKKPFFVFAGMLIFSGAQGLYTFLQPYIGIHLEHPYSPLYSATKSLYGVYVANYY